ncbi:hypothetical protein [uncultured Gammaproteobacteria bacterium]|nr:hypothetical protein [uncultured Gammaproteobacteria bacterium]
MKALSLSLKVQSNTTKSQTPNTPMKWLPRLQQSLGQV